MLIGAIRILFSAARERLADALRLARVRRRFPKAVFHARSVILDSTFGDHAVLFTDTIVDSSSIGAYSYIQKRSVVINAEIGKFCSIGTGVSIGPGKHKTDGVTTHPAFYLASSPLPRVFSATDQFECSERVHIGNDVWIGERAIVLDGLTIGDGAIIAAGAIVTRDVEPFTIVGGVPARVIRKRFDEATIATLMRLRWWDKPDDWLQKNHLLFGDPTKLFDGHDH